MTIFTTRFLPMVETLGLACPRDWEVPRMEAADDGTRRTLFAAPGGTVHIAPLEPGPVDLVILRHGGIAPASIAVSDAAGRETELRPLPATGEPLQYAKFRLGGDGPWRLALSCEAARAWSILTARPVRRTFHVPDWKGLEALTPGVRFRTAPGAREVLFRLRAEKEGFRGGAIHDPAGNVRGVASKFIEFGDEKPYVLELRAPVPPEGEGRLWRLDLQSTSVLSAEGALPWVSATPAAFFIP
jgi:hypothetical protein